MSYIEWEADKAQMFVKMTTENVPFQTLGEYIAYRYDVEIVKEEEEKTDFFELED